MLTLVLRALETAQTPRIHLDVLSRETASALVDLAQTQIATTATPILCAAGTEVARRISWSALAARHRLELESTWHFADRLVILDAVQAPDNYIRFAAVWSACRCAGLAGYRWAATWYEGPGDAVLDKLWFRNAGELHQTADAAAAMPPLGRRELACGTILEWLPPSARIMKRFIYFAEECKIDWESLLVEDLTTQTAATYLELREGYSTVALARVVREPSLAMTIESFEVHPDHQRKGYGAALIREVQRFCRPIYAPDMYGRSEIFWKQLGFVCNAQRSDQEGYPIFEWAPLTGQLSTGER